MRPSDRLKKLAARNRLDIAALQAEINKLLADHPELAEDEILRADMIEGATDAYDFLAMLVRKMGEAKALELGVEAYADELLARRNRFMHRRDRLRELIFKVMNSARLTKVELPEATLSIRAGQAKVIIVDELEIPEEYLRIKTEPDKIKIKAALQNNEHVPGAMLSNVEPVLAIHIK